MEKLSKFVIRFRWPIIAVFLIFTVIMGMMIKKARFNADMQTYLPETMEARVNQKQIEKIFGGTDLVMVVLKTDDVINRETLERVKLFSHKMKKIKGIEKVMSLFDLKQVRNENEAMIVDPAVKMIPGSEEDIEIIKMEISENDLVYGSVVSKDFTTTAVIGMVTPGTHEKPLVEDLRKLIRETPGKEDVMIGGSPYIRAETAANMQRDIVRLLPAGILLMLVFLYFSFRQFRGVWLSATVVFMSIIVVLGLIPMLGWDITLVTIILAVLIIAVANNYGVQLFAHYQDVNVPGNSFTKEEMSRRMLTAVGKPVIVAGLTTIVGLLCMFGHILIPAEQMGVLGAVGMGFALLMSLLFIPAVNSLLPKPKPVHTAIKEESTKGLNRILLFISGLVVRKPRAVVVSFAVLTFCFALGIFRLSVNTNPVNLYPDKHQAKVSSLLINSELGGFFPLSVVFEGDIKNPEMLNKIDRIENKIREIPQVGTTQSIARVVRQISRALNTKSDPAYDKIPDTYNAVSQYFELYLMNGDPEDFEKMTDFSFKKAMILVRFKELNTPILRECVKEIREMVKNDPDVKIVGGNADIFSQMDKEIVDGQFKSIVFSVLTIMVIIFITFRSLKGAVLQIIPLVSAIVILFGIMGITGIELNFTTALLSSIMIGEGVDYTTHLTWRYREERGKGLEVPEALKISILTTGRGIIFNAFSVILGFSTLMLSSFLPVRFFGLLIAVIIFVCLAGGLLFIPAFYMIVKPAFCEPASSKTEQRYIIKGEEYESN